MYGPISPDSGECIAMRIFNRRCVYLIFVQFLIIYHFMTRVETEYDLRALWARYSKRLFLTPLKFRDPVMPNTRPPVSRIVLSRNRLSAIACATPPCARRPKLCLAVTAKALPLILSGALP